MRQKYTLQHSMLLTAPLFLYRQDMLCPVTAKIAPIGRISHLSEPHTHHPRFEGRAPRIREARSASLEGVLTKPRQRTTTGIMSAVQKFVFIVSAKTDSSVVLYRSLSHLPHQVLPDLSPYSKRSLPRLPMEAASQVHVIEHLPSDTLR